MCHEGRLDPGEVTRILLTICEFNLIQSDSLLERRRPQTPEYDAHLKNGPLM